MPTDRELMQRMLFNLEHTLPFVEDFGDKEDVSRQHKLIADLYARLAQPEPEPVAWLYVVGEYRHVHGNQIDDYYSLDGGETRIKGIPLYTTPPQREWQGLTDEEIVSATDEISILGYGVFINVARAIEAKLKEKNEIR